MAESIGIPTGFINKTMQTRDTERPYVVYVPREYDPAKEWPLILFLHGAGERGDDGLQPTEIGIGRAIRLHPERFPAIVVFPQCPEGVWWDAVEEDIGEAMRITAEEYAIDPERRYLTGLSMGGYATWIYGADHADAFAALMPICGGGEVEDAEALARVPIWAFHGAKDDVVLPAESRTMVEAVKNAGGDVRYTEFPEADHHSWNQAYEMEKAIKWLFRQKR